MHCNILVTSIGSFSANCVINELVKIGCSITGCDIYPSEWHSISKECNKVYRSPLARYKDEYINFLMHVCDSENIQYVFPLTDIEIDVLNEHRKLFNDKGVVLCMPSHDTLLIARDKYALHKAFEHDDMVPTIKTYQAGRDIIHNIFPCIAKPHNGRSSEGLRRIDSMKELDLVNSCEGYIIQELIDGPIFTVDYVRSESTGNDFSVPRKELLRTKNGAGTTISIVCDENLSRLASHIGKEINVNGVVNMEFIKDNENYYLIDINPRFSAGVAFTNMAGYNMVINHLNCHSGKDIDVPCSYHEQLMTKRYYEEIL
jgi:carbamoyl-phosphate synthase large subunit